MAIRLLHLADLHLGAHGRFQGDKGEARRKDFQHAFEHAVEFALAVETRVDAVLICGDLFDTHSPSPHLVDMVRVQVTRLREEDIPVVIIPGFHDSVVYPDSIYHTEAFPGTHLLLDPHNKQPVSFEFKGTPVHFYGSAWNQLDPPATVSFKRFDLPGLHVALLHGDVGDGPQEVDQVPVRFKLEELQATGMDYIALGYRHNYEVVQDSDPAIVYPGTLEAVTFDETEARAFLVVQFDVERAEPELTLTRVPYKSRPVLRETIALEQVAATDHAGLAAVLMRWADAQAMVLLELTGTSNFIVSADRLRDLIANHFFYLEIVDRSRFSDSPIVRVVESERTIRGMFTRQLLEELKTSRTAEQGQTLEYALKAGLQRFLEGELL